ncbi:MAG: NAD(P)-binding domain-containing protein [Candidatus Parvarchaeota archaeon]|nr:NAD(P)-binding domain-containing protein [Candidatus Rehaiarchaeum fermentans]MCW1293616.1 NAD(P)-binding domain-containing protein [Candidatus Rehaiarchaeum fermentans]
MKAVFVDLDEDEFELINKEENTKQLSELGLDLRLYKKNIREINDYDAEILSTFINSRLDKDTLSKFFNLKYIITRSTGYDHIDLEYCKQKGILAYNIPDYGTESVAEFALMLMLALSRKLKQIGKSLEEINLDYKALRGSEIKGKTIGIVGTGRIGSNLIKLLYSFGVNIIAYNRSVKQDLIENYKVNFVELDYLLSNSDYIVLALPLSAETKHIINLKNAALVKKGAYIINIARGELIDTNALLYLLENNVLSGLGLDVIEGENLVFKENDINKYSSTLEEYRNAILATKLIKYNNVIITPHIAYDTKESIENIVNITLTTLKELVKNNKELYNRIN